MAKEKESGMLGPALSALIDELAEQDAKEFIREQQQSVGGMVDESPKNSSLRRQPGRNGPTGERVIARKSPKGRDTAGPAVRRSILASKFMADFMEAVNDARQECSSECSSEIEYLFENAEKVAAAFARYLNHEVVTLDEAFGAARPKNYQRAKEFERRGKQNSVFGDFLRLYHAGAPVDESTWQVLADIHQIPASKAREYVYAARKARRISAWNERALVPPPERLHRYLVGLEWWNSSFQRFSKTPGKTSK